MVVEMRDVPELMILVCGLVVPWGRLCVVLEQCGKRTWWEQEQVEKKMLSHRVVRLSSTARLLQRSTSKHLQCKALLGLLRAFIFTWQVQDRLARSPQ